MRNQGNIAKKIEIIFNQRRHIKCYVLEMQVKKRVLLPLSSSKTRFN